MIEPVLSIQSPMRQPFMMAIAAHQPQCLQKLPWTPSMETSDMQPPTLVRFLIRRPLWLWKRGPDNDNEDDRTFPWTRCSRL